MLCELTIMSVIQIPQLQTKLHNMKPPPQQYDLANGNVHIIRTL